MRKSENKIAVLRTFFQGLTKDEKEAHLRSLSREERRFYTKHPDIFLFDKQIIPEGDWYYFLLRCGRGFGKSYTGAAQVAKWIRRGAKKIGLCGPTYDDVADTMVPMILSWFLPEEFADPSHPYSDHKIKFASGGIIYCYSSEVEKKGPNLEYLWCDEIATWCQGQPKKIQERFEDISRAVRVGKHPQVIITSTPKNHPFFVDFQAKIDGYHSAYRMIQGSMFDNPALSQGYKDNQVALYAHNARGKQEIYGDLLTETPGAYWTHPLIDAQRVASLPSPPSYRPRTSLPSNAQLMGLEPMPSDLKLPYLLRTLVGFDPSGSSEGDECGIIVGSLYSNKEAYVTRDASGSYNPDQYVKLIADLYQQYQAGGVVVETNFGGKKTFEYVLRSKNANMKIIPIHNSDGKTTRAEHISALYAQGKVHHLGSHKLLEEQMCKFNVDYSKSPDRLDALGLLLTELFWPTDASGNQVSILNLPSRN